MPPRNIPPPSTDQCILCHRPSDPNIVCKLADLITAKGTNFSYHEPCAGYSRVIANAGQKHGKIRPSSLLQEYSRGRGVLCSICNQPGATITCIGHIECKRNYHLPCAREAAMSRVSNGQRPHPNANNNNSNNNNTNDIPVFSAMSKEVACRRHEAMITHPIHEPAGIWFEGRGGWDAHCPQAINLFYGRSNTSTTTNNNSTAATTATGTTSKLAMGTATKPAHAVSTTQRVEARRVIREGSLLRDKTTTDPSTQHTMNTTAAAHDMSNVNDNGVYIKTEYATPEDEMNAALAALESFVIPNHVWDQSANVESAPPLRPGEGQMLGVTFSAPVFAAARKAIFNFLKARERRPSLKRVVLMRHADAEFNAKALSNIEQSIESLIDMQLQQEYAMALNSASTAVPRQTALPKTLPTNHSIRIFRVSPDDPRQGLANDPNALGVRVKKHSQGIKANELIGVYGGLQLFLKDYNAASRNRLFAKHLGLRTSYQLSTKFESYAVDEENFWHIPITQEDKRQSHYDKVFPEVQYARKEVQHLKDESSWLITSGYLYGNITSLINDPAIDPFQDVTETVNHANCNFMMCLIWGWPFVVVVSNCAIAPGEELLIAYGKLYWRNLEEKIDQERNTLAELEEERLLVEREREKKANEQVAELQRKFEETLQMLDKSMNKQATSMEEASVGGGIGMGTGPRGIGSREGKEERELEGGLSAMRATEPSAVSMDISDGCIEAEGDGATTKEESSIPREEREAMAMMRPGDPRQQRHQNQPGVARATSATNAYNNSTGIVAGTGADDIKKEIEMDSSEFISPKFILIQKAQEALDSLIWTNFSQNTEALLHAKTLIEEAAKAPVSVIEPQPINIVQKEYNFTSDESEGEIHDSMTKKDKKLLSNAILIAKANGVFKDDDDELADAPGNTSTAVIDTIPTADDDLAAAVEDDTPAYSDPAETAVNLNLNRWVDGKLVRKKKKKKKNRPFYPGPQAPPGLAAGPSMQEGERQRRDDAFTSSHAPPTHAYMPGYYHSKWEDAGRGAAPSNSRYNYEPYYNTTTNRSNYNNNNRDSYSRGGSYSRDDYTPSSYPRHNNNNNYNNNNGSYHHDTRNTNDTRRGAGGVVTKREHGYPSQNRPHRPHYDAPVPAVDDCDRERKRQRSFFASPVLLDADPRPRGGAATHQNESAVPRVIKKEPDAPIDAPAAATTTSGIDHTKPYIKKE